jgi:soluble lytic murein transglycosylase-like protein
MKQVLTKIQVLGCLIICLMAAALSSPAFARDPLLKKIIAAQNAEDLQESLADGSYRGEAGILRISPKVGASLGMKVLMDQDYVDAVALSERAEESLENVKAALVTEEKEAFPGQHAQQVAEHFLRHTHALQEAEVKLKNYESKLRQSDDERLNETVSQHMMDRLLADSLEKTANNLRDGLGRFYNVCRGLNRNVDHLTSENVVFVNNVFHQFLRQRSEDALFAYNLDRQDDYPGGEAETAWKSAMHQRGFRYLKPLETVLNQHNNKVYTVDPLLFIALMRKESNFDPLAVSSVGAAGLTQIMPQTGLDLGMKNIFRPAYFHKAADMLSKERKARRQAWTMLGQMSEKNKIQKAKQARTLMQTSLAYAQKRHRLYLKYKRELLKRRSDDRLKPSLAIEYGFKYFARLMKAQKGDISLALASYNAGPHRVKQYRGIPPYEETVRFRNKVLEFYREYLEQAIHQPGG